MRKARILIVEDETDVADANRVFLESEGYEVICAINLHEAQNALSEYPPDLILLDVLLPDGSGYDFCREIRAFTSAPVIFLTCLDDKDHIVGGFSLGAADYITKPYNMDILGARIAARLRSVRSVDRIISLSPLKIDLYTGKSWLSGEEIALSAKEIQLLAFFAENIGREFTTDEIYLSVWGEGFLSGSGNTVRVHISNLRSKLLRSSLRSGEVPPFEINLTPNKKYIFQRAYGRN